MKVKTSVTLSQELLDAIDRTDTGAASRSEYLERVAWKALRQQWRKERGERDIAIYNAMSDADKQVALDDIEAFGIDPLEMGDPVEELLGDSSR